MNQPAINNNRLDYLDAVRAFALILGIVFHASLSFMPMFIGWAVMDISTSNVAAYFALVSHSFRMELFFLIAGFFSHMTFHRQGAKVFLQSRLVRIAIPFVVGWFVLRPLLVSGWIAGADSMRGDADVWSALEQGLASLGAIPEGLFVGTHLWFLYYLILLTVSVLMLRAAFHFVLGSSHSMGQKLLQKVDRIAACLCQSRLSILWLAIPTAAILWFMQRWGVDTPDKSLVPHWAVYSLYGSFFLFGWLMHRQSFLMSAFAQLSATKCLLGIVAIIATALLTPYESQLAHPSYRLFKGGYMLSYAVMMWSLVSLTIGICERLFSQKKPSKLVRYVADASYWLYLVHLPIVVFLQVAFAELDMHWTLKLTSICVLTIGVSLVLYDAIVRSTWIGALLNGKRQPRVLFRRKQVHNKVCEEQ